VVVREDFNQSLAKRLVRDIEKVLQELEALPPNLVREVTTSLVESCPQLIKENKDIDVVKLKSSHLFHEIVNSRKANSRKAVKAWKKFVAQKPNRSCLKPYSDYYLSS
jgi:hypothetical protein